jgi:hypothetical protein
MPSTYTQHLTYHVVLARKAVRWALGNPYKKDIPSKFCNLAHEKKPIFHPSSVILPKERSQPT